jgi:hypothetical protein
MAEIYFRQTRISPIITNDRDNVFGEQLMAGMARLRRPRRAAAAQRATMEAR